MEGIIAEDEERKEKTIKKAIPDPLGFGYEGRVAAAEGGAEVDDLVGRCAITGRSVPGPTQAAWFLSHGFYTGDELMLSPEMVMKMDEGIEVEELGGRAAC